MKPRSVVPEILEHGVVCETKKYESSVVGYSREGAHLVRGPYRPSHDLVQSDPVCRSLWKRAVRSPEPHLGDIRTERGELRRYGDDPVEAVSADDSQCSLAV
jgi:hypothetical protein